MKPQSATRKKGLQGLATQEFDWLIERIQGVGFTPKYIVTWHYKMPCEYQGKQFAGRRKDVYAVELDTRHIKNVILSHFWGIDRPDKARNLPTLIFFHERCKNLDQYHTHMLMSEIPAPFKLISEIEKDFNTVIKKKARSLSRMQRIDAREVYDYHGVVGYCLKRSITSEYALDVTNSTLIYP